MKDWGKNKKAAEIKGEKVEKIMEITKENGERLFKIIK
jgi:Tat protein secretion system quality control protein TatD with DNase activity